MSGLVQPILRWGILGAADIARKNWKAIWNSQNGQVVAVASRQLERSRRFIDECQAQAPFPEMPQAYESYEQLLASPKVDAVYVPLPTGVRAKWIRSAAEAGKHVICEKPCATSVAELAELFETCRSNHVQFMDGVMFMHSARLGLMRKALRDQQELGRIRRITSVFTFNQGEEFFATNIRARSELEPDGCLGDLGWYCIRFALWALDWNLPQFVSGRSLGEYRHPESQHAVPSEFTAELDFEGGISSSFYCSFITELEQWAVISGTRGHLWVPDFVLPFRGEVLSFATSHPVFSVKGCDFNLEPHLHHHQIPESSNSHRNSQEANMFRNFGRQVQSGTLNTFWLEVAMKTQQVLDACRESAKVQSRRLSLRESQF
jgi:predicted dehydrogenase